MMRQCQAHKHAPKVRPPRQRLSSHALLGSCTMRRRRQPERYLVISLSISVAAARSRPKRRARSASATERRRPRPQRGSAQRLFHARFATGLRTSPTPLLAARPRAAPLGWTWAPTSICYLICPSTPPAGAQVLGVAIDSPPAAMVSKPPKAGKHPNQWRLLSFQVLANVLIVIASC
jgi:hypothetical protein